MIDRRSAPRHRVLKGATIAFDGIGLDCTVRNISDTGAALEFASSVNVPPSFMLVIAMDQTAHQCHSVWSNERRVGVAFD